MDEAVAITAVDTSFVGAIPDIYERYMVPLMFEPYARDLVGRLQEYAPERVLEVAAGTGVVTRALARSLPATTTIVATDLNPQMLARARAVGTAREVEWRQADAMSLPFGDASFDLVVCQFGVMFFPDKPRALAEAARVLRPGGRLVFSVWDRIGQNEFAETVQGALASMFPDRPIDFMSRVPHGYFDPDCIRHDLRSGGLDGPASIEFVNLPTTAESPRVPAVALCQGTPMRLEIEARDPAAVPLATDVATVAVSERFGSGRVTGASRALLTLVAV
jgi:SAM-dependent methyltransferase